MTQAYPLTWPEGWMRTPSYKRSGASRFQTTFVKARDDLMRGAMHDHPPRPARRLEATGNAKMEMNDEQRRSR